MDDVNHTNQCRRCKTLNSNDIVKVEMPYTTKLLLQELQAMLIYPRLEGSKRVMGNGAGYCTLINEKNEGITIIMKTRLKCQKQKLNTDIFTKTKNENFPFK